MHKPRYFSTWNMSVVSAKHFPGNPWARTVKNFMALNFKCRGKEWKKHLRPFLSVSLLHAQGKHGVNIPYHTPSTSRKTAKTSVTFIMSIIFYRCIGLTADSIINHRNLAKVCKNVHGSFPIARTILKQEVDPPCQLQLSLVAQPLSIATFLICLAIQFG